MLFTKTAGDAQEIGKVQVQQEAWRLGSRVWFADR